MKILIIAPTPYFSDRGCHVRIFEEANALKEKGHKIELITYHLGKNKGNFPIFRTINIPWYKKISAGPSWHKIYIDFFLLLLAIKRAIKFKPNIIHCHLHEGFIVGYLLNLIFKIPFVFDCQGSLTAELVDHNFVKKGSFLYKIFCSIEKWIYLKSTVIVTSSANTANYLIKNFKITNEKIVPLIDGITPEHFPLYTNTKQIRKNLNLPINKKIAVYIGVLNKYQGIDLLLKSIKILKQKKLLNDLHFLIIGYPNEKYKKIAKNYRIIENITFIERIKYDEVSYYLSACDIGLSPKISKTEANGKLFNYGICGLPCVVFRNSVNEEILGKYGIYAEKVSPMDYAEKIIKSIKILKNWNKIEYRNYFIKHHNWQKRIELLEEIYNKLSK